MRSDLPDRDSDEVRAIVEVAPDPPVTAFGAVFDRWVRGDLRSRDEMDLEAAIATYHAAIEAGEEPSVVAIVAAAWGE